MRVCVFVCVYLCVCVCVCVCVQASTTWIGVDVMRVDQFILWTALNTPKLEPGYAICRPNYHSI